MPWDFLLDFHSLGIFQLFWMPQLINAVLSHSKGVYMYIKTFIVFLLQIQIIILSFCHCQTDKLLNWIVEWLNLLSVISKFSFSSRQVASTKVVWKLEYYLLNYVFASNTLKSEFAVNEEEMIVFNSLSFCDNLICLWYLITVLTCWCYI